MALAATHAASRPDQTCTKHVTNVCIAPSQASLILRRHQHIEYFIVFKDLTLHINEELGEEVGLGHCDDEHVVFFGVGVMFDLPSVDLLLEYADLLVKGWQPLLMELSSETCRPKPDPQLVLDNLLLLKTGLH